MPRRIALSVLQQAYLQANPDPPSTAATDATTDAGSNAAAEFWRVALDAVEHYRMFDGEEEADQEHRIDRRVEPVSAVLNSRQPPSPMKEAPFSRRRC